MSYEQFLRKECQQGELESSGAFQLNLPEMRRKLAAQFRGEEGLWLVCLLQSLVRSGVQKVSVDTQPGRMAISFKADAYPTPEDFAPFVTESKAGTNQRDWCLLRALLGLPPELRVSWFGPRGLLKRKNGNWSVSESSGRAGSHVFKIENFHARDNWRCTLLTLKKRIPLPPLALFIDSKLAWEDMEAGDSSKLLFCSTEPGEEFRVKTPTLNGKFAHIQRLGLQKSPVNKIVYLQDGARVHERELPFKTNSLSVDIFVSGQDIPVDLSGFAAHRSEELEAKLREQEGVLLEDLNKTFSSLISRPKLPLRLEEERRQEAVVSSAVALGGLSFLQVPFFHPLVALGTTFLILGGVGARALIKKKQEPWRGEHGMRQVRRDLVEARKEIVKLLESSKA